MTNVLTGSVGPGGRNDRADTKFVQMMLNDWLGRQGKTLLKVDGLVGPKTSAAILSFQKANGTVADGRVDPAGPTIRKLISLHLANLAGGLLYSELLKAAARVGVKSSAGSIDFDGIKDTYLKSLRAALR